MDNYREVIHQMESFGIELMPKDLPLVIDHPKRRTFGKKGKAWYWLRTFRPDAGGAYIVGVFGSYKTGESQKVEVDWKPLSDAERSRREDERQAAEARKAAARAEESEIAALSAGELWCRAMREGRSPYLERKQVTGEACRFLPNGTLVVPLLRYDLPRDQALRAVQRILPNGSKFFTKGSEKPGCAVRLGEVTDESLLILVCEGYVTGLSIRMALEHLHPVFVGLDAGNLQHVVRMLRTLYPDVRLLICADDDWKTVDRYGNRTNPGRTAAMRIAKSPPGCGLAGPICHSRRREDGHTDCNDLHVLQGLPAVRRQLRTVIVAMERQYG